MLQYRSFRNTDPPRLVEVWNEAFTGRGAVHLRNSSLLERFVFAKPYYDPAGLIVAEQDGVCVGFAHAGFGGRTDAQALSTKSGVICLLGVRPAWQRRGIGTGLVQACETYLRQAGAEAVFAGPHWPLNPFYQGLYGGGEAAGFLASDPAAESFFRRRGYEVCHTILVMQRALKLPVRIVDTRFVGHRQKFDVRVAPPKSGGPWWQECVFNVVEPLEFYLEEKTSGAVVARTLAWEMEGFGQRWNRPAVGLVNIHVDSAWRGQGLGKYLLTLLLRHIQEQFFEIAELHVAENNELGIALSRGLGFEQVDVGRVFKKVSPASGEQSVVRSP